MKFRKTKALNRWSTFLWCVQNKADVMMPLFSGKPLNLCDKQRIYACIDCGLCIVFTYDRIRDSTENVIKRCTNNKKVTAWLWHQRAPKII